MDKLIKELELRGRGADLNELDVREASGDWTRTSFTDVDLNRRYSRRRAGEVLQAPAQMTERKDPTRLRLGIAALLTVGMIVFCALRLRVNNDVIHFLPAGTDHRLADLSRQLADSSLTRTMILDVGGADPKAVRDGAAALAAGPGRASGGGVGRTRADARARRGGLQAVRAAPALLRVRPPGDRGAGPALRRRRWIAPPARSSSRWRSRWRRCSRGWRRPTRCSGSRRSCVASNARGPDRSMSDGDQLMTPDRRHAIIFLGTRHSALTAPRRRRCSPRSGASLTTRTGARAAA